MCQSLHQDIYRCCPITTLTKSLWIIGSSEPEEQAQGQFAQVTSYKSKIL